MTADQERRRVSSSNALRLVVVVLPSLLAVALALGLVYYGQMERAAPGIVLVAATVLALTSLVLAWANARYFAGRIARLARAAEQAGGAGGPTDEFDRIESAVGTLGTALSAAAAERASSDQRAAALLQDEATMLAGVVSDALAQLDQVRLPLHILLESRFGDLNENQEELLRDARGAADAMDLALRQLGQVADADRGAAPVQRQLVQVNDVVRSVLPLARAAAERQDARVETALEPALPRVSADRTRLAEALTLLVTEAAAAAGPNAPLRVATSRAGAGATIHILPATGHAPSILASRLLAVQGGSLTADADGLTVRVGGE